MNQNGKFEKFFLYKIFEQFLFLRIIPNIIKNATNDFNKSLASLVFSKDDQIDDDSK